MSTTLWHCRASRTKPALPWVSSPPRGPCSDFCVTFVSVSLSCVSFSPLTKSHLPSRDARHCDEEDIEAADTVMSGQHCGHCRIELFDADAVYECNHVESRGRIKYDCDHAFHASCVHTHYASMYDAAELKVEPGEALEAWACPSCTGCVLAKNKWKNTKVYYCSWCLSPFSQAAATQWDMMCFYCKRKM